MEGLNNLFQCLFGITLEVEDPKLGEVWYTDVQKLVSSFVPILFSAILQIVD